MRRKQVLKRQMQRMIAVGVNEDRWIRVDFPYLRAGSTKTVINPAIINMSPIKHFPKPTLVGVRLEKSFFFLRPLFVDEGQAVVLGHPIQVENQTARQDPITDSEGGILAKNAIRSGRVAKLDDQQVFGTMSPKKELKKSYVKLLASVQQGRQTAIVPILVANKDGKYNLGTVLGKPVGPEEVLLLGVECSQKVVAQ